jgi:hypothetical protein
VPCPSHPPWLNHSNYIWHWGCSRTGCWGEYLDWGGIKWRENGGNYIMRSFIICTLC